MEHEEDPNEGLWLVLGTIIMVATLLADLALGASVLSLGWTLGVRSAFPGALQSGTLGDLGFWPALLLYGFLRRPWLMFLPETDTTPQVSVLVNGEDREQS